MKFKTCLLVLLMVFLSGTIYPTDTDNILVVNADLGEGKISRHIYGHFSEHLGRCIYGGFWVGEDSPIPNTRGIRKDVVKALRELAIPNLRWPGGCFADEYHWMDGIGPRELRPEMVNTHWGGVTEDNSFGTHEFMDLCDQLGCEAVICGNLGSGTVKEMSQWVEYLTSDNISPMTDLRKKNGREQPWKVRYWGVGNENWGCGGNMRPEFYADLMRRYSTYLRNYGKNRLYKVACGPYGEDYNWTEVLMKDDRTRRMMQGLALHYYTVHDWGKKGSATDFDESGWFTTLKKTWKMEELINRHSTIMDRYDPAKRIALIVDEWGNWHDVEPGTNSAFLYQQNTMRDAMVAAINLNIFNNHSDRVRMANIAQTINVLQSMLLTKENKLVKTPTFYVFKMFKVHHDASLLPVELTTEPYSYKNESIPALSASASKGKDGDIHISLANLNPEREISLSCDLRGTAGSLKVSGEILTAETINAFNDFDRAEAVHPAAFIGFKQKKNQLIVTLPARSVVVLKISN